MLSKATLFARTILNEIFRDRIVNFFYKNIVGIGVLWWFQIYCAWSTTYVFEYTYLLFWNVFWSLAPVIAIGIFDRNIGMSHFACLPI